MPFTSNANLILSGSSYVGFAGSKNNPFNKITLNGFTASNDMYAVNFDINGKVILNNNSLSGAINLSTGSMLDGSNGTLNGNVTGNGDVIVGQSSLSSSIGLSGNNVGTVTFTPAEHRLGSDIFGTKVIADNSSLILDKSVQIANLSAQNLTLTPNSNSLSLPSGGDLSGLTTLNLTVTSLASNTTPYINVTSGNLHLSNLRINITDSIGVGSSGAQMRFIGGANDYVGTPDIVGSRIATWTYNNKTGILSAAFDKAAIDKVVYELKKEISGVENYFDEGNTGDAALAMDLIANATPEEAKEIVAELQSVSQDVAQSATFNDATLDNVRNIIDQQTNNYFNDTQNEDLLAQADLGVSAGEEEDKSRRVWISKTKTGRVDAISDPAKFSKFRLTGLSASGFGGFSDLGVIKGASGNRTKTYGATTGIDTRISERWMAGGAFTYTENNVAMHNALTGSTYSTKSWVATLYGLYNITNSWSLRAGLSCGKNTSINNAKRLVRLPGVRMIAYAKYNSRFLSPDVSMSYRISLPKKINFVPSIGLQYTYTISDPYTEVGAKPLNMTVKKRPETGVLSGNIGLSFSTFFKIGETLIKPEIHGSFKRALRGRNPTTHSKIDGAARFIETKTHPTKKVIYSVGGSVTVATSKTLDLGVGYDASLAEKFIGHRGSLKVRINL